MPRFLAPLLAALVLAACGGGGGTAVDEDATLLLDFQPNAVHAGIYVATSRGYTDAEGVDLEVEAPGQSTDALKLLESGDADLAILDIHDLGLARAKGADIVGVMALVQRPLAAILAQPEIRTPKDLEGERVGVTGLPSDDAVLESILRGAGADPAKVRKTTIGFEAVRALAAGRVAGATAFWNAEGVALRAQQPDVREFRVDEFGAPRYPELVLVVARRTLDDRPDLVRAVIRAFQRGYVETIKDPESAVTAITDEVRDLDRGVIEAQLDAVAPAFFAGERDFGRLVPERLEAWADWDVEFGILAERPAIDSAFDTTLVGRVENP